MLRCSRPRDVTDVDTRTGQFFPPGPVGLGHMATVWTWLVPPDQYELGQVRLWNWAMRLFSDGAEGRPLVAESVSVHPRSASLDLDRYRSPIN